MISKSLSKKDRPASVWALRSSGNEQKCDLQTIRHRSHEAFRQTLRGSPFHSGNRVLPARAEDLRRQDLDLRHGTGSALHRHAKSAAPWQWLRSAGTQAVLHYREFNDACIRDRADGKHRKIAHLAAPASTTGRRIVDGRDCVFFRKEGVSFKPEQERGKR